MFEDNSLIRNLDIKLFSTRILSNITVTIGWTTTARSSPFRNRGTTVTITYMFVNLIYYRYSLIYHVIS